MADAVQSPGPSDVLQYEQASSQAAAAAAASRSKAPSKSSSKSKKPVAPTPPPSTATALTPDQIRQQASDKYGAQLALINSVPELASLFDTAIKENWSASKWQTAYQNSQWFQGNSASFRDYETARKSDAGNFSDQYNNLLKDIQLTGQRLGIDTSLFGSKITPDQVKNVDPNGLVGYLLSHYYNKGVPSTILDQYVSSHGSIARIGGATGVVGGTIASTAAALRAEARSQGLNPQLIVPSWKNATMAPGTDYFENAAQAIQSGSTTQEAESNYYKQLAASTYKPFAQQIMDGTKVDALASPYINTVANLLEVDPSSIDLSASNNYSNMVTKALQGDGSNPMTLDAFTTSVKQNPAWLNTSNARNSMMDTAYSLLRNFGLVTG